MNRETFIVAKWVRKWIWTVPLHANTSYTRFVAYCWSVGNHETPEGVRWVSDCVDVNALDELIKELHG